MVDDRLGLDEPISRRDFLNGTRLTASVAPAATFTLRATVP